MKFHDTLNTKLWSKNDARSTGGSTHYDIKPEVTAKLKEIAQTFIEYADIPEDAVEDIVLTGSSASYNYTPLSDIDLHLIVDYDKLHGDCPIVENYLWSVKAQFNKEHDITIYDIPVELYAEDKNAGGVSNGIYSIKNDEWIKKPKRIPPTDNDAAVLAKYNEFAEVIEKVTEGEEAEQLLDKIYAMRKSGLQDGGEFSVENLAFKKLRDTGLLEMLKEMKKVEFDKELSLENKQTRLSKIFTKLSNSKKDLLQEFADNIQDNIRFELIQDSSNDSWAPNLMLEDSLNPEIEIGIYPSLKKNGYSAIVYLKGAGVNDIVQTRSVFDISQVEEILSTLVNRAKEKVRKDFDFFSKMSTYDTELLQEFLKRGK